MLSTAHRRRGRPLFRSGVSAYFSFQLNRDLKRSPLWLIAGAILVAIVAADFSGLSRGEVERIWLPFVPWLSVAVAAIPDRTRRNWLGAQALLAIGIQTGVATPW